MVLKRITRESQEQFQSAYEIYRESFPVFERRRRQDQINALKNEQYHFEVAINNKQEVLGILLSWQTDKFIFIEHIAISKEHQGKSIGSKIINLVKEKNKPIILEIDLPTDKMSEKRQRFYQRLGFNINPHEHYNIIYRKEQTPHMLKILSIPMLDEKLHSSFIKYLHGTVAKYTEDNRESIMQSVK